MTTAILTVVEVTTIPITKTGIVELSGTLLPTENPPRVSNGSVAICTQVHEKTVMKLHRVVHGVRTTEVRVIRVKHGDFRQKLRPARKTIDIQTTVVNGVLRVRVVDTRNHGLIQQTVVVIIAV